MYNSSQLNHPSPPPAPAPAPPPPVSPPPEASAAANAKPDLIAVKPRMIIKGVLGRYERWNPVHPTAGTFWGVGLGLGCGVGWGPGFGPEVIGYVGAGCGVGFSVGFTLAGVGIGLPQHGLIRSHEGSGFASNVPLDSARYYAVTIIRGMVWDAISYAGNVAAMRKEFKQKLLRFQDNPPVSRVDPVSGNDLPKLAKSVDPVSGVDLPKLGKGVDPVSGVDLPKLGKRVDPVSGVDLPKLAKRVDPVWGVDLPKLGKRVDPVSGVDLPKLGKGLSSSIQSTLEFIRAFKDQHWPP